MQISIGDFREFGPRQYGSDIVFTTVRAPRTRELSLILYDLKTKEQLEEIVLTEEYAVGRVYSVRISGLEAGNICYLYSKDGTLRLDDYGTAVCGRSSWAAAEARQADSYRVYSAIAGLDCSWQDTRVSIPPTDMIIYKVHMRGFTAGMGMSGSKVGSHRGFLSKLDYLKGLGVTSVEFMPIYDFEELMLENRQELTEGGHYIKRTVYTDKVNYWGYGPAAYYAPKASYFGKATDGAAGLRELVGGLHAAGMECILEMSFDEKASADYIIDCLRYYIRYFHIDGFHLIGLNCPIERIAADAYLGRTKIFCENISESVLSQEKGDKHLFIYNDSYMNVTRQIQNHMNGSLVQFANHMKRQNSAYGFVNYMASVCGFSLWDSYSYGEKHNYENGEENRDGTNNNFSFNYGCEGKTNNKSINNNRFLQMRNAFACLMLSQAVPLIVAADEVADTHEGNNNPYCQDNKLGYTCYSKTKNRELLRKFVGQLIEFRKTHPCIRSEGAYQMNDYKHLGLPDMSFHGTEPWMMTIGDWQMALGVLYNGAYTADEEEVYVCYNFHYDSVDMALPLLAPGKRWRQVFNTREYNEESTFTPCPINNQQSIIVPGGSVTVLVGIKP